jgi:hypothetical protein
MIMYINTAATMEAVGIQFSWYWFTQQGVIKNGPICEIQGFLLSVGFRAEVMWTLLTCLFTFYSIFLKPREKELRWRIFNLPAKKVEIGILSLGFGFPILSGLSGFLIQLDPNPNNFYSPAGYWCWMDASYKTFWILYAYLWVIVTMTVLIIVYPIILCSIRKLLFHPKLRRVTIGMIGYPRKHFLQLLAFISDIRLSL